MTIYSFRITRKQLLDPWSSGTSTDCTNQGCGLVSGQTVSTESSGPDEDPFVGTNRRHVSDDEHLLCWHPFVGTVMGLFRKLGRQVEQFKTDAEEAAEEYEAYQCEDCGMRFNEQYEQCSECGSRKIARRGQE